jgi:hypothetical protein
MESKQVIAAKTYKAGWMDYRTRDTLQHAVNFAKGVLIGGIVVLIVSLLV